MHDMVTSCELFLRVDSAKSHFGRILHLGSRRQPLFITKRALVLERSRTPKCHQPLDADLRISFNIDPKGGSSIPNDGKREAQTEFRTQDLVRSFIGVLNSSTM
jgi:hypothetical protein